GLLGRPVSACYERLVKTHWLLPAPEGNPMSPPLSHNLERSMLLCQGRQRVEPCPRMARSRCWRSDGALLCDRSPSRPPAWERPRSPCWNRGADSIMGSFPARCTVAETP